MTDLRYDLWQQAVQGQSLDPSRQARPRQPFIAQRRAAPAAPAPQRPAQPAARQFAEPPVRRPAPPPQAEPVADPGGGDDPVAQGGRMQAIVNWSGAVMSLALIAGVLVWGYGLMVRDVSGIPVVRALDGPMRIAPEEPGGRQAAHRGLAVNAVAGGEGAAPPPDQVALAPLPVSLDTPLPVATRTTAAAPVTPAPDRTEAAATPQPSQPEPASVRTDSPARTSADGLARSPIPPARPTGDLVAEAAANAAIAALTGNTTGGAVREVSPDAITVGTRLVQLGAYDSAEAARADWDRMAGQFGALMADRARVVQEAESGGRAFWRLRAHGFADEADARQFCAAVLAHHATCIPVLVR